MESLSKTVNAGRPYMADTFLSNLELQTEQAKAEGYINGPAPALNSANIETQHMIGNTSLPKDVPALVPYYPGVIQTPNMGLNLSNLDENLVANFEIIDAASLTTSKVVLTLTAAQVQKINSVPIQIIPAPGVGYLIQVQQAAFKYNFGTTKYTVTGGAPAWVAYYKQGSNVTAVSVADSTWMTGTTNGLAVAVNTGINDATYAADLDNAPLYIKIGSGGADPTGGDGTVTIEIWYFLNEFVQTPPLE